MSDILVTVVVPVYNAQDVLWRCINNLKGQTLIKNMEIILVDDGSYDDSSIICDFLSKENMIRVISQDNAGMGVACNKAISHARGKYIAFLRPYDVIEADMYETLYSNALLNDSDLVKCGLYFNLDDKTFRETGHVHTSLWEENILKSISQGKQPFTLWENKALMMYHSAVGPTLYRTDFIKSFNFSTDRGTEDQDILFSIKTLLAAKRISVVHKNLYCLNCDVAIASGEKDGENLMCVLDQIISAKKYLINNGYFNDFFSEFYQQVIMVVFERYNKIRDDLKPVFLARLREFFADIDIDKQPHVMKYFSEEGKGFLIDLIKK